MSKKGLTFEEKQSRLLTSLTKRSEFWERKEIEKIGVSAGIVYQSVKDVLQSLLDDGLVKTDKIGAKAIFWALQSDARVSRENKLVDLRERLASVEQSLASEESLARGLEDDAAAGSGGDADGENSRTAKLRRLASLREELQAATDLLKVKNAMYIGGGGGAGGGCCTAGQRRKQSSAAEEAIVRWTDNICVARQWICNRKPGTSEDEISKHFSIPEDLW